MLKVRMTGTENIVLSNTSKTQETKSKVVKYNFIKVRNFYRAQEKKINRIREIICKLLHKGFIHRIYEDFNKFYNKSNQI